MSSGVPDGQAVVLDVAQLQALLARTFNVGLDVVAAKRRSRWFGCDCPKASIYLASDETRQDEIVTRRARDRSTLATDRGRAPAAGQRR